MTNNLMRALTALDRANREIIDVAFSTAFDLIADDEGSQPRSVREAILPMFDMLADDAADDPDSHPLTPLEYDALEALVHRIAERIDREDLARRS